MIEISTKIPHYQVANWMRNYFKLKHFKAPGLTKIKLQCTIFDKLW